MAAAVEHRRSLQRSRPRRPWTCSGRSLSSLLLLLLLTTLSSHLTLPRLISDRSSTCPMWCRPSSRLPRDTDSSLLRPRPPSPGFPSWPIRCEVWSFHSPGGPNQRFRITPLPSGIPGPLRVILSLLTATESPEAATTATTTRLAPSPRGPLGPRTTTRAGEETQTPKEATTVRVIRFSRNVTSQ